MDALTQELLLCAFAIYQNESIYKLLCIYLTAHMPLASRQIPGMLETRSRLFEARHSPYIQLGSLSPSKRWEGTTLQAGKDSILCTMNCYIDLG